MKLNTCGNRRGKLVSFQRKPRAIFLWTPMAQTLLHSSAGRRQTAAAPGARMVKKYCKKVVVIGNGMAGARVVEEILKRAPGMFDIVMFGAEPYGNYNRILLSNVLNRTQQ